MASSRLIGTPRIITRFYKAKDPEKVKKRGGSRVRRETPREQKRAPKGHCEAPHRLAIKHRNYGRVNSCFMIFPDQHSKKFILFSSCFYSVGGVSTTGSGAGGEVVVSVVVVGVVMSVVVVGVVMSVVVVGVVMSVVVVEDVVSVVVVEDVVSVVVVEDVVVGSLSVGDGVPTVTVLVISVAALPDESWAL